MAKRIQHDGSVKTERPNTRHDVILNLDSRKKRFNRRSEDELTSPDNNQLELSCEVDLFLDGEHEFAIQCQRASVCEGVRHAVFPLETLDGGPHPVHGHTFVAVASKKPRLDKLAPCHDLFASGGVAYDGVVVTPRSVVAVNPPAGGARVEPEQPVHLRHPVYGTVEIGGAIHASDHDTNAPSRLSRRDSGAPRAERRARLVIT